MKLYKQILAGFLAMNLVVTGMPTRTILTYADEETGSVDIEGSSFYDLYSETEMSSTALYSEENIGTQAEENTQPLPVDTEAAEISDEQNNGIGTENVSNTDLASDSVTQAETTQSAPIENSSILETTAPSSVVESSSEHVTEQQTEQTTGQVPESTLENTTKDTETVESSEIQSSEESTESISEESTEEITTEEETEEESTEEESTEEESTEEVEDQIELFSARDGQTYLNIEALNCYNKDTNTVTINGNDEQAAYQLILLSNCDPNKVKNVTIVFSVSGNIDATKKIPVNTDLTELLTSVSSVANVGLENKTNTDLSVADENLDNGNESNDTVEQNDQDNDEQVETFSIVTDREYSFLGIGTKDVPFEGTISGGAPQVFKVDTTFFGGLSSKASVTMKDRLTITWCGTEAIPMIAGVYQFDEGEDTTENKLPIKVVGDESKYKMGSLLGTVRADAKAANTTLVIGNDVVDYSKAQSVEVNSASGNAGLICNTLENGMISLDGYAFPINSYTINTTAQYNNANDTSAAGNAGGVIGVMKKNTTLNIKSAVTVPEGISVTSINGNAGGLIGLMENDAKIITGDSVTVIVKKPNVTGKNSSGGVSGMAENAVFSENNQSVSIQVSDAQISGSASGADVGGFIGSYTVGDKNTKKTDTIPSGVQISNPTVWVNGAQNINGGCAGGYFGSLNLVGEVSYTIGTDDAENKQEFSSNYKDQTDIGNAQSYGALIGQVTSTDKKSTLLIQNLSVQDNFTSKSKRPKHHGGLVGCVGAESNNASSVYLEVKNVTVTVKNPHAGDYFGGVTAHLAKNSILKVNDLTLKTSDGDPKIWEGGGLVGLAEEQSVVELLGITDFSNVQYIRSGKSIGWLVAEQKCALIYAKGDGNGNGWSYKRGSATKQYGDNTDTKNSINDIGNYGQIIRLKSSEDDSSSQLSTDLITISEDHTVKLKILSNNSRWSENKVAIYSADDFALYSIAWNSHGYFSADSFITNENWSSLRSKDITLNGNIDLSGSGIAGLSRDTNDNDNTYTGNLDGNNHTITLAIGEPFGLNSKGDQLTATDTNSGRVYAKENDHAAQGIFAKTNTATIKNLTIDGNIYVSNADTAITAGGIAAFSLSESSDKRTTISNVTAEENIYAYAATNTSLSVGGLYGEGSSGGLTLESNTTLSANISLSNANNIDGSYVYAGEIFGQITPDSFKLAVNGLIVGGSNSDKPSTITTDASTYAYVGGLVGVIKPRAAQGDVVQKNMTENRWMEIRSLKFQNFKIGAKNATSVCGGLFGAIWANVGVFFMGEKDDNEGSYKDKDKLTVESAIIEASNATYVGGLAYRSSGEWEIRNRGINIKNLSISTKGSVGLLVCKGAEGTETIDGTEKDLGALYLCTTKSWTDAYQLETGSDISITQTENTSVFDEFVAYTADPASGIDTILWNGQNGVVSLASAEDLNADSTEQFTRVGVAESRNTCTTYQNRSAYGKDHQTNGWSRYYYDLDLCWKYLNENSAKRSDGKIDSEQELLLWTVYCYVGDNIKHFFSDAKDANGKTTADAFKDLKSGGTISGTFNMEKYSYYPIDISNSITVQDATFQFYNQQIEQAENYALNKSTQISGTDKSVSWTQHYTMHCGLFLSQIKGDTNVTVNNVTFSGSIGKVHGDASGVLFAGSVAGSADDTGTGLHIATVSLNKIRFDGLTVNNCGEEYAPLLINRIGSYSTLNANDIRPIEGKTSYQEGTPVASSLIGYVGAEDAKQINLSFLNIFLPDKKAENSTGIFSHATLLEAFQHDGTSSVATYNFYMDNEWQNDIYTHGVTYGKEITETTEYKGQQLWYYDEKGYGDNTNLVHTEANNLTGFSAQSYLPYVYAGFVESEKKHEIKVNQRVADITHGCGTYGHPYKITSEREMTILSEYMATGSARTDWRVTITGDQSAYHVGDDEYSYNGDKVYQFDGAKWIQVKKSGEGENWTHVQDKSGNDITLSKDFMLQYLLNAYYDLQGTEVTVGSQTGYQLKLSNFGGFGIATRPFRGVITSTNGATVVLSGASTSNGLIPYSYGSVVKNLKISYVNGEESTGKTLSYNGTKTSAYYPDVCFGGVIGCVLGGDNIIDNVTVTIDANWLTISGDKKHLIPVGAYVGSVSGGGVIFRDMTDQTGLTDAMVSGASKINEDTSYSNMYVNPYVGRVLDGFVFYEKISTENGIVAELKNTDKNYNINTLNTTKTGVENGTDGVVAVKDNQGLLILSAIVNSGAASGGNNNTYSSTPMDPFSTSDNSATYLFAGKYGKVRNASYNAIGGTPSDTEKSAFQLDDQTAPQAGDTATKKASNLPYLIKKYCSALSTVYSLSSSAKIALKENGDFNMSTYGTGYQGIGARYVSSAILYVAQNASTASPNAKGIVPELSDFNGKGNTVTLNMQVNEYTDDDFPAAAVGGILNLLRTGNDTSSPAKVQNLMISGSDESGGTKGVSFQYYDSNGAAATKDDNTIDVGTIAGAISGLSAANNKNGKVTFESVTLKNLTVNGSRNAGGLLGSSKKTEIISANEGGTALLIKSGNKFSVGVEIKNTLYETIAVNASNSAGGYVGYLEGDVESSIEVTDNEKIVGKNSSIGNTDNLTTQAGGAFGYVKASLKINANTNDQNAIMENITVKASDYAGGFVGRIDQSAYEIHKGIFRQADSGIATVTVGNVTSYAGGIVGLAKGSGNDCKILDCGVYGARITSEDLIANTAITGGHGGIVGRIEFATVAISDSLVQNTEIKAGKSGGILGSANTSTTITNCTVQGSDDTEYDIIGSETAGGIIGLATASNANIQLAQCTVQNMKMTSKNWGCGGMLGDVDWASVLNTLYLFDCSVEKSEVIGSTKDTTAGGFVGDIRGKLHASNLLLSDTKIHATLQNKVGLVIGMADDRTGGTGTKEKGMVSVAGLSIQKVTAYYNDDNSKTVTALYGVIATSKKTTEENMNTYSYFALADYFGEAANASTESQSSLLGATGTAPYVVTSPKSTMSVYEGTTATASARSLYGDGAYWETTGGTGFTVMAQKIWKNKGQSVAEHYAYGNTGVDDEFDPASVLDTYNANQNTKAGTDFPVLQISGGNVTAVENYLNILTNGGFSAANNQNTSTVQHVTATTTVYEYETGKFIKSAEKAALEVVTNNGQISFRTTTDYDNTKNRFTLLTVTFTEKDINGKTEHNYNVLIPVLVRRMLEIDFTATLTYGTDFRSADYKDLTSHVLESFGSSITGYLTYVYNSAEGTYTDYGWESYINAGGNVAVSMQKSIRFQMEASLPKGTQMTLVDVSTGKSYYYTATGTESKDGTNTDILMSSFKNSAGEAYEEPSLSEIMRVTVGPGENNIFIEVDENGKPIGSTEEGKTYSAPTVKIKEGKGYKYYRLAGTDETGSATISVDENQLWDTTADTSKISENYYLVITVPKDATGSLNGSIQTVVKDVIPNQLHYRKIGGQKGSLGEDGHSNTASTYRLSSGYQQSLTESNISATSKKITMADSVLKVDVTDTITFSNDQFYNDNDNLYFRLVGGLQKTIGGSSGESSAEQFPVGTTGTAKFFVYSEKDGGRTYYQYNDGWTSSENKECAVSYLWTSEGGSLELPLSTDGSIEKAISLQAVRKNIKGSATSGDSQIFVEVVMDVVIPVSGFEVIPESSTGATGSPENFTKLTYSSQISTVSQALSYTSNQVTCPTTMTAYYREESNSAKLTYEADVVGQLGINLLDLQSEYLDGEKLHSLIDTTATYDLSGMKNLEEALKASSGIKFTLTLQQKSDTAETDTPVYNSSLTDANKYMDVEVKSPDSDSATFASGSWTWTVPKSTYYDATTEKIMNNAVFNGTVLTQIIQLKVNVTDVEQFKHYYSNYRVVLKAEILSTDGKTVEGTDDDDNIIYTLARIKPEFFEGQ